MAGLMEKLLLPLAAAIALGAGAATVDTLCLGDSASEKAHGFSGAATRVIRGGLGEAARVIEPPEPADYRSEPVRFTMKVDPERQNYFSAKFWGGEVSGNLLILQVDGKQLGYRHLGDYDILDHGAVEPQFPGRFLYVTFPLPRTLTHGKRSLEFELHATGRIWGYGNNFKQYQKDMVQPSRGLYRFYTHTGNFLEIPADEARGAAPAAVLPAPEKEDFSKLKARVERDVRNFLKPGGIGNQMQIQFLAQAYFVEWSRAYRNPAAVRAVIEGIDRCFVKFRNDPKLASDDRSTWNPGWFGFGPIGEAIVLLRREIEPELERTIPDEKNQPVRRRAAWAEMLKAANDHLSTHRRMYTNQSMIIDMNLHWNNRALNFLAPEKALPEELTLGFLKEAVGLRPWSGSLGQDGKPVWPQGKNYFLLTAKGLTKELGYVGSYGEVLDWATDIYEATRPEPGKPGDPEIADALKKIIRARSCFRHPSITAEGCPVMRLETVVGWRDVRFPGDVTYAERPTRDASVLYAPMAVRDPYAIGLAQQMVEERQFFRSEEGRMKEGGFRVTAGLLHTPTQYEALKKLPREKSRLPMSPDQPDFLFSDEENGVLALKNGDEILYASLYWRARFAVNFLAKFHYITPSIDRQATVRQEIEFEPSGMSYTRPNWTNFGFSNGGGHIHYPGEKSFRSAHFREVLPIAKIPEGIPFRAGQESPWAGRGEFYRASYGPFEIGMNASRTKEFTLRLPANGNSYRMLPDGRVVAPGEKVVVKPMTTVVLREM